jgi:hypothetical protein
MRLDETARQNLVTEMFKGITGAMIVEARALTDLELEEMGWSDSPHPAYTLYLSNGLALTASCDEEGNGPGALFIDECEVSVEQVFPGGIGPDSLSYEDACAKAADEQGITDIFNVLKDVGIDSVIEQTGGMTMVLYLYGANGSSIGVNAEIAYFYAEGDASEGEELGTWGDGSYALSDDDLAKVVATVQANLHLLGGVAQAVNVEESDTGVGSSPADDEKLREELDAAVATMCETNARLEEVSSPDYSDETRERAEKDHIDAVHAWHVANVRAWGRMVRGTAGDGVPPGP